MHGDAALRQQADTHSKVMTEDRGAGKGEPHHLLGADYRCQSLGLHTVDRDPYTANFSATPPTGHGRC